MSANPVAELARLIEAGAEKSFGPQPGDYVELVDEEDPEGLVRLCRAHGALVAIVSREAYEKLCATVCENLDVPKGGAK